jgi:hypothetical protein
MDKELKAKWVAALRSGAYQQTTETLKDRSGFCCLGVLLDLSKIGQWEEASYVYDNDGDMRSSEGDLCSLRHALAIPTEVEVKLVEMNDGCTKKNFPRHSFAQIADYIESTL